MQRFDKAMMWYYISLKTVVLAIVHFKYGKGVDLTRQSKLSIFITVTAYDTCYYPADFGTSYRGLVNFTDDGPCLRWDSDQMFDPNVFMYYDYILEHGQCSNDGSYKDVPWCLSNVIYFRECGVPVCGEKALQYHQSMNHPTIAIFSFVMLDASVTFPKILVRYL